MPKTQAISNILHAAWWILENKPFQKVFPGSVFRMLVVISFSWQALPTQPKLLLGTQLQRTSVGFAPSSRSNTKISLTYPATQAVIRWQNSCSMIFFHVISGRIHLRTSKCALQIKKLKKGFFEGYESLVSIPVAPKMGRPTEFKASTRHVWCFNLKIRFRINKPYVSKNIWHQNTGLKSG